MPQAHRSRPILGRPGLLLAPLAGAAALIFAAGPAAAESLSRGGDSNGHSNSGGTLSGRGLTGDGAARNDGSGGPTGRGIITHGDDPTGLHDSDPFGYYHSDMNPVLQNQHPRSPQAAPAQPTQPLNARTGNPATTWTPSWNADGSGYTVCPALANHC